MKDIHVLLVEDNEGDVLLTTEALLESTLPMQIHHAKDGWEALLFLKKNNGYSKVVLPDLILLDINLPKVNGHEVLHFIKSNDGYKHIPVIMLTSSSSEADIEKAKKHNVNFFMTKFSNVEDFQKVTQTVESFFSLIV